MKRTAATLMAAMALSSFAFAEDTCSSDASQSDPLSMLEYEVP